MRYKDQATTVFSEIASIIESSDNAENNIYDIVDFMIGIMSKDQLNQVEDMLTNNSFEVEDLELVQSKMSSMIEQLEFWSLQDNRERFIYELKSHIAWLLKTFS